MNNSTEDRRVRKTKKALREGLAELMMEKDLRSITVRELTDKVDIHRATFYTHYKDIYDLYEQIEDAVVNELSAIVGDVFMSDEVFFKTLVDYISDNSMLCRMLLNRNGNRSFLDRVSSFLEEKYIEIWTNELGKIRLPIEWHFGAAYHIGGCLAVISKWAEGNYTQPKEKIVEIILSLDTSFDKLLMQWKTTD